MYILYLTLQQVNIEYNIEINQIHIRLIHRLSTCLSTIQINIDNQTIFW